MPVSTVHTILRNRLYTGQFEWNGKLIQGKHDRWFRSNCGNGFKA